MDNNIQKPPTILLAIALLSKFVLSAIAVLTIDWGNSSTTPYAYLTILLLYYISIFKGSVEKRSLSKKHRSLRKWIYILILCLVTCFNIIHLKDQSTLTTFIDIIKALCVLMIDIIFPELVAELIGSMNDLPEDSPGQNDNQSTAAKS